MKKRTAKYSPELLNEFYKITSKIQDACRQKSFKKLQIENFFKKIE